MPVFRQIGIHLLSGAIFCGAAFASGQAISEKPPWCQKLPRPEYSKLHRIPVADTWFEVYKVAPDVFAIYEPHQFEETISYLILGRERAVLFDTGMGIGDLKAVTTKLTTLPVIVLNSHTHNDHVGDNWQFDTVYGMDTEFTRQNAKGSKADAQAEIAPGEICGALPAGFDRAAYATRPWHVTKWLHDGDSIDLGGRTIEVIATAGAYARFHLPVRSRQWAALFRGHILPWAYLAFPSGNGFGGLWQVGAEAGRIAAAGEIGSRRSQRSCCAAGSPRRACSGV